jgi:hypothetical protein
MEGGVVVFLALVVAVGLSLAAIFLSGAGGYARHKQVKGELGDDGAERRPEHLRVEDETGGL